MRKKFSLLNVVSGMISQFILIILGLIARKIFVSAMGLQILGINGLFSNIISMLGLAELGVGGAIYYSLFKPLADHNYEQVCAIIQLYRKIYKYVALAVACIGFCFIPFLHLFIKENFDNTYLISVYLCFLLDAVISYLLVYKKNIFSADQKSYILNIIQTIFSVTNLCVQILIITTTHDYILYLVVRIVLGFLTNVVYHLMANRRYPYLKTIRVAKLDDNIKAEIIKNTKALFIGYIAGYLIFGTDNILISAFVSITTVGIYSNYYLIINIITTLTGQVFEGIRASFGNFLIKESLDRSHDLFHIIYFVNFWISCLSSVCLIVLLNPFIEIWIGKNVIFPFYIVLLMIANFYLRLMTYAIETVKKSAGFYSPYPFFKFWAMVEGIINIIIGITLAGIFKIGIAGILIATTISTASLIFVMPWNVYKYIFKRSVKPYVKKFFLYLLCFIFITSVTLFSCSFIMVSNSILKLLIKAIISFFIPNIFIILLFHKTSEYRYIRTMAFEFIKKKI